MFNMTSQATKVDRQHKEPGQQSLMPAFPVADKKQTSIAKLASLNPYIQTLHSSPTSDKDSTSKKTCGVCGFIHAKPGGNKIHKCPTCGTETPRDANGVRNIMLRALRDSLLYCQ
jgi:rubrerythrin